MIMVMGTSLHLGDKRTWWVSNRIVTSSCRIRMSSAECGIILHSTFLFCVVLFSNDINWRMMKISWHSILCWIMCVSAHTKQNSQYCAIFQQSCVGLQYCAKFLCKIEAQEAIPDSQLCTFSLGCLPSLGLWPWVSSAGLASLGFECAQDAIYYIVY